MNKYNLYSKPYSDEVKMDGSTLQTKHAYIIGEKANSDSAERWSKDTNPITIDDYITEVTLLKDVSNRHQGNKVIQVAFQYNGEYYHMDMRQQYLYALMHNTTFVNGVSKDQFVMHHDGAIKYIASMDHYKEVYQPPKKPNDNLIIGQMYDTGKYKFYYLGKHDGLHHYWCNGRYHSSKNTKSIDIINDRNCNIDYDKLSNTLSNLDLNVIKIKAHIQDLNIYYSKMYSNGMTKNLYFTFHIGNDKHYRIVTQTTKSPKKCEIVKNENISLDLVQDLLKIHKLSRKTNPDDDVTVENYLYINNDNIVNNTDQDVENFCNKWK